MCIVFVVVFRPVEVCLDTFPLLRLLLQAMPILAQQICAVLVYEFVEVGAFCELCPLRVASRCLCVRNRKK